MILQCKHFKQETLVVDVIRLFSLGLLIFLLPILQMEKYPQMSQRFFPHYLQSLKLRNANHFMLHLNQKGLITGIGTGTESVIGILSSCLLRVALRGNLRLLLIQINPLIQMNLPTACVIRFYFCSTCVLFSGQFTSSSSMNFAV